MMKRLVIIFLCTFPLIAWSQTANFQMRVDELYSGAPQNNAQSEFGWEFQISVDGGNFGPEYCFHVRGEEWNWFSYSLGQLNSDRNTDIILNKTVTPGQSYYHKYVRGWEDDGGDRCEADSDDDYRCSNVFTIPKVDINYEYVDNKPGAWYQREEDMCSADGKPYISRTSYMLAPPKPSTLHHKDISGNESTHFCKGQSIALSAEGTSGYTYPQTGEFVAFTNETDLEYVWEYNLNNEQYVVSSTCAQYGADSDCDGYPDGGGGGIEVMSMAAAAVDPGGCQVCIDWNYTYAPYYRSAGVSAPNGTLTFPVNSTGTLKFRAAIRNKTTGIMGQYLNGAVVNAYSAPPVFPADAPENSAAITLTTEAQDDNSFMTVDHVKCYGGSTGKISIKSITGPDRYYYNLKRASDSNTQNINADGWGAPSALDPVVFPDESSNSFALTAGTYYLRVENIESPGGVNQRLCYSEETIVIRQPAAAVSGTGTMVAQSAQNPYSISCNGLADGRVDVTGSGGILPYTYTLGTVSQTGDGTLRFGSLTAGTHTVTITDGFGCPNKNPITTQPVTQPEVLTINTPSTDPYGPNGEYEISCNGATGKVGITTAGDNEFQRVINVGSTSFTIDESEEAEFHLPVGTHRIYAKYPHGCSTFVDVSMTQPNAIGATRLGYKSPSCLLNQGENDDDGYLQFNITGGIPSSTVYTSYLVGNPGVTHDGATPKFEELLASTYDLVVTDEHCTDTIENITLPVTQTPLRFKGLAVIVEPSCHNYEDGKITLKATSGVPYGDGYTFSLDGVAKSGHSSTAVFDSFIGNGTYSIRVEDSKLCFKDSTVSVGEPTPINVLFSQVQNICRGDSLAQIQATLGGGIGPYKVRWINSLNDTLQAEDQLSSVSKLLKLPRGTYDLLVKDDHGCTNEELNWLTMQQTIGDPDTLKVSIFSFEDISCNSADDGYVSVAASGGWGSFKYSKDSANFISTNGFEGLLPGLNKFFVKDAKGCIRSTQQFINEPSALEVSIHEVVDAQCFGFTNGSVELLIAGGSGPYYVKKDTELEWIPGNKLTGLPADDYIVNAKDEHGCAQDIDVLIGQPSKLLLTQPLTSKNSTCGDPNGEAAVFASGGITPYVITWYNSANDTVNTTLSSTTLYSDVYRVTVVDGNKCLTPLEVEVSDEGAPIISNPIITIPSCSYSSDGAIDITLSDGTQPYNILWSNNQSTEDISGLPEGSFRISIVDGNNCKVFRSYEVDAPAQLDVLIDELKHPTCFEYDDAILDVSFAGGNGGYIYEWSNGPTTDRITGLSAGIYTLTLTDSKSCAYEESFTLTDPAKLVLGLEDRTMCVGQTHTVTLPVENGTYQWTSPNGFTSDQRTVIISQPGTYNAYVTDIKGCIAEEELELTTSTDLLSADFLVLQEAHVGDTVVVIDISWPIPDQIFWNADTLDATILYQGQDYTELIFSEPGTYTLGMYATLGECYDTSVQTITILDEVDETGDEGGRQKPPVVSDFNIFPNPNDGEFTVEIILNDEVPGTLRMISLAGNRTLIDYKLENNTSFTYEASLGMVSGMYFIILEVGGEQLIKRVLVR
jgi:hypothetical protein